jgi:hypothetical protein
MELKMNLFFAIAFDGIHTNLWWNNFLDSCSSRWKMLQHLVMVVGRYQNDSSFVDKFSENTTDTDNFIGMAKQRNQNIGTFTDGYAIQKFRNVTVNGVQGSDKAGNFRL